MKLAAFDLEIYKSIPEGETNWHKYEPLGVSCCGFAYEDETVIFGHEDRMNFREVKAVFDFMKKLREDGYTIVTWNGAAFDFKVLAQEGFFNRAINANMTHVDLMLIIVALRGHYLGLVKAAEGMGVAPKLSEVTFKDGSRGEIDGAKVPDLWKAGERTAVKEYLEHDVKATLELAQVIRDRQEVCWLSGRGNYQRLKIDELYLVHECLTVKRQIPQWLKNPKSPRNSIAWTRS